MKKEQEILESVKKIKDTLITSEEEKKQKAWVYWIATTFFISLTVVFFAITMKRLNTTTKYPMFSDNIIKIIAVFAFLLFVLSLILLAIFLRKRYVTKSKTF